jgi:hypothetical protein
MLAPESGEEGTARLPAARPLVVLGRFVLLTATGYRLPAQPAAPRKTVRRAYPG